MGRTHRKDYTKHTKRGRKNEYGLCACVQCKAGRRSFRTTIEKMKRKFRRSWKNGKEFVKGLYTD